MERVCRNLGRTATDSSVGARRWFTRKPLRPWSHPTPPIQGRACGHKTTGADCRRGHAVLNSAFISTRRDEPPARPAPCSSSRPAVSWTRLVHVPAKRTSRRFVLPHGIPARARPSVHLELADAFNAASGSRSSEQFRHGGTFFFPGSLLLSLAVPPAVSPLHGQGAFGSSLKGIPPIVPSFRPAPPPFDERAIPLLKIKKGTICPPKSLNPPRQPRTPPSVPSFQ